METSRRSFLKAGALAALVLAAGGGIYRATQAPGPGRFVLDGEARAALGAIVLVDTPTKAKSSALRSPL